MGNWKPFQVGREDKQISHLCFADDMLLFAEANEGQSQGYQKRIFDTARKM